MDGGGSLRVAASNRSAIGVADDGAALDTSGTPKHEATAAAAASDMALRVMRGGGEAGSYPRQT